MCGTVAVYNCDTEMQLLIVTLSLAMIHLFSMTQLRELENGHHERLTEIGTTVFEKFTKNQLEEEPHEDLRVVSQQVIVGRIVSHVHSIYIYWNSARYEATVYQPATKNSNMNLQMSIVKLTFNVYIHNNQHQ